MTLPNAARALGEHRQTVLNRSSAGEVESIRMDGFTFIRRADVERILAARTAA